MFEKREVQKRPLLAIIESVFIAQSIRLTLHMHFQAWFWCRAWWDASFEAYFICLSGGLVFFDNPVFSHMMSRSRACACCLALQQYCDLRFIASVPKSQKFSICVISGLRPRHWVIYHTHHILQIISVSKHFQTLGEGFQNLPFNGRNIRKLAFIYDMLQ